MQSPYDTDIICFMFIYAEKKNLIYKCKRRRSNKLSKL
jgi:hypothetical protein